jgi:hypothetical protein
MFANRAREKPSMPLHVQGTETTIGSARESLGDACEEGNLRWDVSQSFQKFLNRLELRSV